MNYRHAFHAGNFADLLKHAALTLCLEAIARRPEPATVIDTHAGAGVYDLGSEEAGKSGEGKAGIGRLVAEPAAPEAFDTLLAAVARINPKGGVRYYPGSPMLIASALRDQDRFIACELRPEEHARLAELLQPLSVQAEALNSDGYAAAANADGARDLLIIIDPPFERGDDYLRIVATCDAVLERSPRAMILIWMPLKDLETFDRFLRDLEELGPPSVLIAECRLRPLTDPLAMNGCVMAIVNPPEGLALPLGEACRWIAATLGGAGAEGRVWSLEP